MSFLEILTSLEVGIIYGIVSMGVYLTLRTLNIPDLSCDGSFMAGAAGCAILIDQGYNPVVSLLAGALVGGIVGLLTGSLIIYGKINALHASILSAFIFYSINLRIMGGSPNIPLEFESTIFGSINALMILTIIVSITWILLSYVLQTNWGLALRCLGQNRTLAVSYGVKITTFTMITLIASNSIIGLGGGLFCQYQGCADISQGIGSIILGLAAVMIGEKLLPSKSIPLTLLMCIIGSILYRFTIALALHTEFLNLTSADLNMIAGIIVIGIMVFKKSSANKEETPC